MLPLLLVLLACSDKGGPGATASDDSGDPTGTGTTEWDCLLGESAPPFASQLGCWDDFALLASEPLDASIPGARSTKTVVDRVDGDELYFQNSQDYLIHWDFASEHLSGDGLPLVPDLTTFNTTEYYSPDRRFLLGAITYYEEPDVWAYEISPYDTASADMIATAFYQIRDNAWFGDGLFFHPGSEAVEEVAEDLPDDVPIVTTDQLFDGISYQPLNLGRSMGQLSFYGSDDLEVTTPDFREIVVLDAVPNDISVVMGIITDAFQTPLSHINVLSQNRGTPNMAFIGSFEHEDLRALEGKWVELSVEAMDWSIREVTQEEADAWWEDHKPDPIDISPMDTSVQALTDEWDILDLDELELDDALQRAIPIFGGKAAHYGGLALIGDEVPHPTAFAIPVAHYDRFMTDNGLWLQVDKMLADPDFNADVATRHSMLADLRDLIEAGTIDPELVAQVEAKIIDGYHSGLYPQTRFRFRSSTNAEDVSGFNGAGLYTSQSGDPLDESDGVGPTMKGVWASLWSDRAFDEREYYSIDHRNIGMALLCHRSFPDERANGVAITANIYDREGVEPGFYINVQAGEESVVFPEDGVSTDQLIYYYDLPGQPIVYIQHSSLVADGDTVLTEAQLYELGTGLSAIHDYFLGVYGTSGGFYGMDTEFKFDANPWTGDVQLYLKQARPYPGWGEDDR